MLAIFQINSPFLLTLTNQYKPLVIEIATHFSGDFRLDLRVVTSIIDHLEEI